MNFLQTSRVLVIDDKPEEVNPDNFNVPMYWAQRPQILSAKAGMHRFLWDLHHKAPESDRDYPISAIVHDTPLEPLGPMALPGTYSVKLAAAGHSFTQPLRVRMDPRVSASAEDLAQQFEIASEISDALNQDSAALHALKKLRAEVKDRQQKTKAPELLNSLAEIEKKAAFLESGEEATEGSTARKKGFADLNADLAQIYAVVNSADAAPTSQVAAETKQQIELLHSLLKTWRQFQDRDIETANRKLRSVGSEELNRTVWIL